MLLFSADTLQTGLSVVYVYDGLVMHFGMSLLVQHDTTMTSYYRRRLDALP